MSDGSVTRFPSTTPVQYSFGVGMDDCQFGSIGVPEKPLVATRFAKAYSMAILGDAEIEGGLVGVVWTSSQEPEAAFERWSASNLHRI